MPAVAAEPVYTLNAPPPGGVVRIGAEQMPLDADDASRPTASQPAWRPDQPVLLDKKVGSVNGRPILASVFLESLMPRLHALRRTSGSSAEWAVQAREIILNKVQATVRDEVLYREARAQLPPEVQDGLFNFLRQGRARLQRFYGGATSAADRSLRETSGAGLDETASLQQRTEIIRMGLRDVSSSVPPVTWADVRNEYDRRFREFNQPTLVFARLIMTPSPAASETVLERLQAGDPFDMVAADRTLNRYRPASSGSIADDGREIPGELAAAELIGIEPLNDALTSLEPGEWSGPIDAGRGRTGFVLLDLVESRRRTLDDRDLQLELWGELRLRRLSAARESYIVELLESADLGLNQQERITDELFEVAVVRVFGMPTSE